MLVTAGDELARARAEVGHGQRGHVDRLAAAVALAQVPEQLVAGDGEDERPEARVLAESLAMARACEKRALHQVLDVVTDLVAEEAVDDREVAAVELLPRGRVTFAPRREQFVV